MTKIDHDAALEWAASLSCHAFANDRNIARAYIAMHAERELLETKLADAKAKLTAVSNVVNSAKNYMVHSDDCMTPNGRCDCGLDIWCEKAKEICDDN